MTTKFIFTAIIILKCAFVFSQVEKKVVGYFDNDNLPDTLSYNDLRFKTEFQEKDISYSFKMARGNGKKYEFNLPLGYESVQISSPKKGFLEIYQWKTGMQGFEQYETFKFNSDYEIFMLQKSVTTATDGKEEIFEPKKMISIDGTEYKHKEATLSGTYILENDNERFSIEIKENGSDYVFSIFDKHKKISSGSVKFQNKKKRDIFFLDNISVEAKGCNLILKNYQNKSGLKKHFVQYDKDYLTFKKKK